MIEVIVGEIVAGLFATFTGVTWASLHYATKLDKQNETPVLPPSPPPPENHILKMLRLQRDDLMFKLSDKDWFNKRNELMDELKAKVKEIEQLEAIETAKNSAYLDKQRSEERINNHNWR